MIGIEKRRGNGEQVNFLIEEKMPEGYEETREANKCSPNISRTKQGRDHATDQQTEEPLTSQHGKVIETENRRDAHKA